MEHLSVSPQTSSATHVQEGEDRAKKLDERMAERKRQRDADKDGRDDSAPGRKRRHEEAEPDEAKQAAAEEADGDRWQPG